ncbi:adenosylcobinamide-GDP ribazoletransferase [Pacificispira sp.]|uniref:adenosylcobinamide-GDP ribazoletransferase n=1 Tax=Pacificispira sp. TaxID=2888761 RepID=UPI003B5189CD
MSGKRQFDGGTGIGARLDELAVAVGFMSRLPVPFRDVPLSRAAWGFPLAGTLIGLISGLVLLSADALGLPSLASAVLALAAGALVTGALHEDGLADCADGFWGGTTPERRLEIMRDSRSGAFGVLALVLVCLFKAAILSDILTRFGAPAACAALMAVHTAARGWLPAVMHFIPAAGKTGLAAMAGRPEAAVALAAVLLGLGGGAAVLSFTPPQAILALILASGLAVTAVAALARRKLGGINGDSLGGMEQMAEAAGLAALAAVGL